MRTKGYAAFSYADLAETVGIRKASIHHYFPTKEDLGTAIIENHLVRMQDDFDCIERQHQDVIARLGAFTRRFQASSDGGLLPLCGALAAEMSALPSGLQQLTHRFFDMQLTWLTRILEQGIGRGEIPCGCGARQKAFLLLSALEGSSLINWATKGQDFLNDRTTRLIVEEA